MSMAVHGILNRYSHRSIKLASSSGESWITFTINVKCNCESLNPTRVLADDYDFEYETFLSY